MKRLITFCAIMTLSCFAFGQSQKDQTHTIVLSLSNKVGIDEIRRDFALLAKDPIASCEALISELKQTRVMMVQEPKMRSDSEAVHIVWCIRGLRYITGGLDFKSQTSHKFSKDEDIRESLLRGRDRANAIPFFAVWMSRDATFFAPVDAQKNIIKHWQDWYQKDAKSYKFKSLDDLNDWYF